MFTSSIVLDRSKPNPAESQIVFRQEKNCSVLFYSYLVMIYEDFHECDECGALKTFA